MQRVPEPEIMDEAEQVRAYAEADFEESHSLAINNVKKLFQNKTLDRFALDLGCGPGDMIVRLLRAFPHIHLTAVDGARNMLEYAKKFVTKEGLLDRVLFIEAIIPELSLPRSDYDLIFSSSLLHHLHSPTVLWQTIKRYSRPGTAIFINDLKRPESEAKARQIVEEHAGSDHEILKRDFYNSLLAAFRPEEVREQLCEAKLNLQVKVTSDRHMVVFGVV